MSGFRSRSENRRGQAATRTGDGGEAETEKGLCVRCVVEVEVHVPVCGGRRGGEECDRGRMVDARPGRAAGSLGVSIQASEREWNEDDEYESEGNNGMSRTAVGGLGRQSDGSARCCYARGCRQGR